MGLPVIDISFEELTASAVKRSSRGTVVMLLEDTTAATAMAVYKKSADIPAADVWTATNIKNIRLALESGAAKVIAIRATTTNYDDALDSVKGMEWNWCCAPSAVAADIAAIVTWIKTARSDGYAYKAVLGDASAPDSEGIVNLTTSAIKSVFFGETTATSYGPGAYTPRIAGVLAGLALDRSATGYVLSDITEITASGTPDDDINGGELIIVFNGEKYEIARGVTSLTTTTSTPELFKNLRCK